MHVQDGQALLIFKNRVQETELTNRIFVYPNEKRHVKQKPDIKRKTRLIEMTCVVRYSVCTPVLDNE